MYKRNYKTLAAIFLTSLLTLSLSSFPELLLAQQSNTVKVGLPGRRVGGGTRGNCNFGEKNLTALVPKNNLALTVAANPQLFFYIPPTTDLQVLEFVLLDESDRQVYEKTFKTTGTSGIISLSLPNSAQLEMGKKYHWYLSVICNAQDRADDVSVDGWIQRVKLNPTLASKLAKVAPSQRAAVYAQADLWQEALTTLVEIRYSRPYDRNISAQWTSLLQSVGLENLSQEPVVAISD